MMRTKTHSRHLSIRFRLRKLLIPVQILHIKTPLKISQGVIVVNIPKYIDKNLHLLQSTNKYLREYASTCIQELHKIVSTP